MVIALLTSLLEHHIDGRIDAWAVVAAVVQGLVALRGFLDQSLGDEIRKREDAGGAVTSSSAS